MVSPAKIGKVTLRAIRRDKAELAVLPGPGKLLRGLIDRFPGLGPVMNRPVAPSRRCRRSRSSILDLLLGPFFAAVFARGRPGAGWPERMIDALWPALAA